MPVTTKVTAFPQPYGTSDPAVRLLYNRLKERQTGATTAVLTLTSAPIAGSLALFKNGLLLDEGVDYTLLDRTVTLAVAAIAGDVFTAFYTTRKTRTG